MWSSYYKAVWTDTKEGAEIEAPKKKGQTELLKRSEPISSDGPHAVRKVVKYGLTLSGETFQDGISISRKTPPVDGSSLQRVFTVKRRSGTTIHCLSCTQFLHDRPCYYFTCPQSCEGGRNSIRKWELRALRRSEESVY
ncbi:hypothetical protein HO173_005509 [Letharia columbiana]|uniref:Uncharacterized protein n=1 Tax=Letharia columbiana TaxID=112416 RepID=A0A8H6FX33_9LECA|nr:uncharacterized protein HO173_005509 [Letharia columbiana]KAF6236417.1 hypothetical protein HO173_005509 [Letharia columbiana]